MSRSSFLNMYIKSDESSIITLYDKLPHEVQKHIVSFTVDNSENNIIHFFKVRQNLMFATRIVNKLNYFHNYKETICIYFSSAMHKQLLNYNDMYFIITMKGYFEFSSNENMNNKLKKKIISQLNISNK